MKRIHIVRIQVILHVYLLGHCSQGYQQATGRKVLQEERRCRGMVNGPRIHTQNCIEMNLLLLNCFPQQDLEDKYTGIVSMLDTGAKVKIDQAHLETIIPAIGKPTTPKVWQM